MGFFKSMTSQGEPDLDYLIVLGAHVDGDKMSKALLERTRRALFYLRENPRTKAVLSGGQGKGESVTEARAMYLYLTGQGIGAERLLLEENSTSTKENLDFSRELIGDIHAKVGVVTNNFHVYRGTAIGKKAGFAYICGIAAPYQSPLLAKYMIREVLAILKDKLMGNM